MVGKVRKLESRILEGLMDPQKEAARTKSRFVRVVAGAGAGKTETLTRRIVILLARGARPKDIVAFTFTERAAAAIRERIYRRVEEFLGPEVCAGLGDMFVGTIHAFCARVLQDHFGYGNFDVLDEQQEMAFVLQHGWSMGFYQEAKGIPLSYGDYCALFKSSESVVNNEMLTLEQVRETQHPAHPSFADKVADYWRLLDQDRVLTFDRLVRLAAERLAQPGGVPDCRHLIVDEYQDINRAQETLILALIRRPQLQSCMVVGDPRQCIYEWRGSDPACFDRFVLTHSVDSKSLVANRRSTLKVIQAANRAAQRFKEPELRVPLEPYRDETGAVVYHMEETPSAEAGWVASEIRRLVDGGHLRYGGVSVLLRSVSTSGDEFVRAFEARGIPYLIGGRLGLFRRHEAKAMAALWLWFAGHSWRLDGEELSADALLGLTMDEWPGSFNPHRITDFRGRLLDNKFQSLTEAYHELLVLLGYRQWNPNEDLEAVRMANLGRFSKLLVDFEGAMLRRNGTRPEWSRLLDQLAWYIHSFAEGSYAEQAPEELAVDGAVLISTVHQAKGLEWPLVFVPALVDRRFPSSKAGSEKRLMLARSLFEAERYEGGEEAERRLFYVAITRARDVLALSRFGRTASRAAAPSRFLFDTPEPATAAATGTIPDGELRQKGASDDEFVSKGVGDIIAYLRCPNQYRYRHLWGYEPELSRELGFGKSLHHVLRVLAERGQRGDDPAQILDGVLEEHFFLPYVSSRAQAQILDRIRPRLASYVQTHRDLLARAQEVETRLEFQLGRRASVTGRADVLVGGDAGMQVVDYKSGQEAMVTAEAEFQLQLYAAGLNSMGRPCSSASIVYVLDEGHPLVAVQVGPRECSAARIGAEKALRGIAESSFPAEPGEACARCEVRRICRSAASQSAPARRGRGRRAVSPPGGRQPQAPKKIAEA